MSVRVLIVDDRPARSHHLEQALIEAGFEVIMTVHRDDDLHDQLDRLQPDAVIIDAELPGRDTLEYLGHVGRRYPRPMIMLADQDAPELTRSAAEAGVSTYAVASLQPALVRSMINVAIASFEQHSALRHELTRTRESINQRRRVDRAKTLIMERRGMNEQEAYQYLRKLAMDRRLSMHELAGEVLTVLDRETKS
ncbi:ANTAR domain-containing response regulator [Kushneria aurantia]|uniref:ANTAR domain-containing response regulator n=1 Tax=Kushneria aurantia TaxID=504092 RepID=A0ABV6G4V9_9GAMM|nr:ANTAR domain-containing protein [Kushneria aurantia]